MPFGADFEAVLHAAQQGDERALEVIYRELAPLVLGYLRGRGATHAEDVTSETFVAVVRNLHRFQGDEDRLRSWVLTIAHRRLIDERRRAGRRPEVAEDPASLADQSGATAGDALSHALDRIAEDDALALLEHLTEDQRAVVLLRIVSDLPVKEVARILGKRQGAVKTLQRRALARLARVLEAGRSDETPDETPPPKSDQPPPGPEPGAGRAFPPEEPERSPEQT